jgi:hypothetical protein
MPSVINSHVQVYLPKSDGQNGMEHYVLQSLITSLVQACLPKSVGQIE